jgi:hypothetical protein
MPHRFALHTGGVTGSIPVAPTILPGFVSLAKSTTYKVRPRFPGHRSPGRLFGTERRTTAELGTERSGLSADSVRESCAHPLQMIEGE